MKKRLKIHISKNFIDTVYYLIACSLCPVLSYSYENDMIASFGLFVGIFLILIKYKTIESLGFYFLAISLQYHVMYVSILGSSVLSIMGLIRIYYIVIVVLYIIQRKYKRQKEPIVGIVFIIIWIFYYAFNGILTGTGIGNVWGSSIIFTAVALEYIMAVNENYKKQFAFSIISGLIISMACFYYELTIGKSKYMEAWVGGARYRGGIMRVGGFQEDPNSYAYYMLAMIMVLMMPYVQNILGKFWGRLLVILGMLSILLSVARVSILALIVCLAIIIYYKQRRMRVLYFAIGLFAVIVFVCWGYDQYFGSYEVASTSQRLYLDLQAVKIWSSSLKNGIIGIGFEQFQTRTYWLTMNEWTRQLCEFGLIGFLFYAYYHVHSFICLTFDKHGHVFSKKIIGDGIYPITALIGLAIASFAMDTFFHYAVWLVPAMTMLRVDKTLS